MILKWINVIMLVFIMVLGGYIAKKQLETIQVPFRCQGITEYNLGEDDNPVKFSVNQDLRLEANARSLFLVKGNVFYGKEKYTLSRAFELSDLKKIDKDTVILNINKIITSEMDNTPDKLFNIYLDEIAFEPETMQIDIVYLRKKAWLIGNPMQFIYTCARY